MWKGQPKHSQLVRPGAQLCILPGLQHVQGTRVGGRAEAVSLGQNVAVVFSFFSSQFFKTHYFFFFFGRAKKTNLEKFGRL